MDEVWYATKNENNIIIELIKTPMLAEAIGRAIIPAPIAVPETRNIALNNLVIITTPHRNDDEFLRKLEIGRRPELIKTLYVCGLKNKYYRRLTPASLLV
jgi:hypothetical protein